MATFYIQDSIEGILELTSTATINISESSSLTKHKVEDGFNVSDNITTQNVKINFSGLISDIRSLSLVGIDQDPQAQPIGNRGVKKFIDALRRIKEARSTFNVVYDTRLGVLENCVLTSLDISKNVSLGLGYSVDLKFEQIRVSERGNIVIERSQQATPDLTQEEVKGGDNSTSNPVNSPSSTEVDRSFFGTILDSSRDLYKNIGGRAVPIAKP